jgi:hypothetical protein
MSSNLSGKLQFLVKPICVAALIAAGGISNAFAACTPITAVPVTITAPGNYCFASNLSYAQPNAASPLPVISISANDVTLDLNGYTLSGTYAAGTSSTQDVGIVVGSATLGRKNTVIRNGTIKGFYMGVSMISADSLVESLALLDIVAVGMTTGGTSASGNMIRNNRISLNSASYNGTAPQFFGVGISSMGNRNSVTGNTVSFAPTPYADPTGISIRDADSSLVSNNYVSGANNTGTPDWSNGTDIKLNGANAVFVENNRIDLFQYGISFSYGSYHVYRDNTTTHVNQPYTVTSAGVKDGGGNI